VCGIAQAGKKQEKKQTRRLHDGSCARVHSCAGVVVNSGQSASRVASAQIRDVLKKGVFETSAVDTVVTIWSQSGK